MTSPRSDTGQTVRGKRVEEAGPAATPAAKRLALHTAYWWAAFTTAMALTMLAIRALS